MLTSLPLLQIARFGVTGVLATGVHYCVLWFFSNYHDVTPWTSSGLGFCAAVGVTWVGQRYWVFPSKKIHLFTIMKFCSVAFFGLSGNVVIMFIFTDIWQKSAEAGFAAGVILIPAMSFLLSKIWVFAAAERMQRN